MFRSDPNSQEISSEGIDKEEILFRSFAGKSRELLDILPDIPLRLEEARRFRFKRNILRKDFKLLWV